MANIWFVRSNGDTVHNDPSTPDYVPDEPPEFPKVECNYRLKCLKQGFARIGWPNTGDLTLETPVRLAPNGYSIHNLAACRREKEKRGPKYPTRLKSLLIAESNEHNSAHFQGKTPFVS